MGKAKSPSLKQVLDALKNQVLVGRTYLDLAKGLLKADFVVVGIAPTFFGLTLDGSLELSQIVVARLYDKTKGAVTVRSMLSGAVSQMDSFQRSDRQQVSEAIVKSEKRVVALEPVLDSIRERRNKWFAHLDPATVADPKALAAKAKLTIPNLEQAFEETENILIEISSLYDGTIGELRYIGGDDYKVALDYLRQFKCSQIKEYEKNYGAWTGSRPKDCP